MSVIETNWPVRVPADAGDGKNTAEKKKKKEMKNHGFRAKRRQAGRGVGRISKRILIAACLILLLQMQIRAEEYPLECHLSIWTEDNDCSREILLVYQIAAEYDPIEERICWASFLEEEQILRIKDEKEIPSLITELEKKLKKEKPFAILSPEKDGPAELTVPSGVYLLIQDAPKDFLIQPSLVTVPYMNEEGDSWIREREIYLKTSPVPEDSEPGTPNTGDDQSMTVWLVFMLGSAVAIGFLLRVRNQQYVK